MSATAIRPEKPPTLREAAAATPDKRDRFIDFLRAFSIVTVVVGHWMIGVVHWEDGLIWTTSAIGTTPWLWLTTWFLQVMPLFFFVGGFSNLVAYRSYRRRGRSTSEFVRSRLARLLRPSLVFIGLWAIVQVALHVSDVGAPTTPWLRGMKPPGATVPFGPLWFLATYAVVLAISPAMIALHRRFGAVVPVAMLLGIVAADVLGFVAGIDGARWANAGLVWLLPHQLGFFYADGRLQRLSRRVIAVVAAAGLAALALLTSPIYGAAGERWFPGVGHYPRSLLGTDVEPIANTYPPTLCLAAMAFWSIGLALLARGPLSRSLRRERPWRRVIAVNQVAMTLFLWHMTAFLLAVLLLWPLGLGGQGAATAGWWLERPLWIAVSGAFLVALVAAFGRFERARGMLPRAR